MPYANHVKDAKQNVHWPCIFKHIGLTELRYTRTRLI